MNFLKLFILLLCIIEPSLQCDHEDDSIQHVTASINYLWKTTVDNEVFMCAKPCNKTWHLMEGSLKQVDASDTEVWGIDSGDSVYKAPIDGSSNWTLVPGHMKHVSASGNGYIWAADSEESVYNCKKPCKGDWEIVNGVNLTQVDAEYRYVYGVTKSGNVYSRPVDGSSSWRQIPGQQTMRHITASGGDEITGITESGDLWSCMKPCVGEWVKMEGTARQCDASIDELYCTN